MNHPLAGAFWVHIIECLQHGDTETRLWLDTGEEVGGFLWWCDFSDKNPSWWRGRLLKAYVPPGQKRGPRMRVRK